MTKETQQSAPELPHQEPLAQVHARVPSGFTEDSALALLQNPEVSSEALSSLSRDPVVAKSRKLLMAVVTHSRTPRHISIPLLRRMFTFDLVQVTKTPVVAADIKRAAEDQILIRLESLPAGQKITLARRASGRIAAELLRDPDQRVVSPALDNPQLTEALVVQTLMKRSAPGSSSALVSGHAKWSQRREVQIALLRSQKTPIDRAKQFARNFSEKFLRSIVPQGRKEQLLKETKKGQS
jgi:hypothetical protein